MAKDGKIILKDLDGNLIVNRGSDSQWWNDEFIRLAVESSAREKGVRVIGSIPKFRDVQKIK